MSQLLSSQGRTFAAVTGANLFGWCLTYFSTFILGDYTFALFFLLPFGMGMISTIIYSYGNDKLRKAAVRVSWLSILVYCLGLVVFAWEGIICILMIAPIALPFTWLGHVLGYGVVRRSREATQASLLLLVISVPALMAFENSRKENEKIRQVITSIEIEASPEEVWKNVIAFPELSPPTELLFKAGIAYPIGATINKAGVGAVRRCNFSTGCFVEPITTWDEPRLLQFSVTAQPEPLDERSFYDVHPPHLNGYWVSKKGQFKLIRSPNGKTKLEGTTWYTSKIKPDFYWTLWSDYIVHKIHRRVLEHIKTETER